VAIYTDYYSKKGAGRNDLLGNPEVVFQTFAVDRANIAALRNIDIDRTSARVLDVGCGSGASLIQFIRLGFKPSNLTGVDLEEERIAQGRSELPGIDFRVESADRLPFADESFDLVLESTMLGTLDSKPLLAAIAAEMIRVTKKGGHIMLIDWRYSREGSGVKTAINPSAIAELFGVGRVTSVIAREPGALVPPLGRRVSRVLPSLYFLVQRILPPAVGQMTTILRKN
jgi:Methylase involved in ubiquinone/menaquinone biosynthesis